MRRAWWMWMVVTGCAGADVVVEDVGPQEAPLAERSMPAVCIHELMPRNQTILEKGKATPDWIELVNATPEAVSLEGWFLSDAAGTRGGVVFEADMVVPANGTLVLYANDDPDGKGGKNLPFKLSGAGDMLSLVSIDGLVDEVSFDEIPADYALARTSPCCEGEGCWSVVYGGTPDDPHVLH